MIVSVTHTGTHFLMEFCERLGLSVSTHTHDGRIHQRHIDHHPSPDQWEHWREKYGPFIAPVRDPALSMMTHRQRGVEDTLNFYRQVANNYRILSRLPCHFIPVDAGLKEYERIELLSKAAELLGVRGKEGVVARYAIEWPVISSIGENQLKRLYRDGHIRKIEARAPHLWQALTELSDLAPWFYSLGYRRFLWDVNHKSAESVST